MKYFITIVGLLICCPIFANPILLQANRETTPIPRGFEETDDAAVWVNKRNPSRSLVLGVSKNKLSGGGIAGLGVYDLKGRELQYFVHDRLNNVDIRHGVFGLDIAAASNRDQKSISFFSMSDFGAHYRGEVKTDLEEEPYGFCLQKSSDFGLFAWLPMKSGMLHQFKITPSGLGFTGELIQSLDTSSFLSEKEDRHLKKILSDEVTFELGGVLSPDALQDEINEKYSELFQLEACFSDDEHQVLYLGMENLGVWRIDLKGIEKPRLILKVRKAKTDPTAAIFPPNTPRVTNDIEGISMHKSGLFSGKLVVSVQGISEYAVLDRQTNRYEGSFAVTYGRDTVTETDGLTISSEYLGTLYPNGIMVLHDHHNTGNLGELLYANYKYLDMREFLRFWR